MMQVIYRCYLFVLISCVLVQSQFFHGPMLIDADFVALLEASANAHSRRYDFHRPRKLFPSSNNNKNQIKNVQHIPNNNPRKMASKVNLRVNTHLPRYLRYINKHNDTTN